MPEVSHHQPQILPRVGSEVMARVLRDLVDTVDLSDLDHAGDGLTLQLLAIAKENPQLLEGVKALSTDEDHEFRMGALAGMTVTYGMLRAQLEVDALKRMSA